MIKVLVQEPFSFKEFEIKQDHFGDGTLKCSLGNSNDFTSINFNIMQSKIEELKITWCYDNDAELFTLISLVGEIRDSSESNQNLKIDLFLPYIPHARQDRKVSDRLFTLKYFAQIINSLNFNKVIVVDPHSDVATALINRCLVIPFDLPEESFNKVWMLPDAGAAKKYSSKEGELFDITSSFIIGNKKRNKEGRIESYDIINFIPGTKEVWIRDDICSYGNTFVEAAKALRALGVEKIYLVLSHCENNILKGQVLDFVDHVYTSNSILTVEHPKITIVSDFRTLFEVKYDTVTI